MCAGASGAWIWHRRHPSVGWCADVVNLPLIALVQVALCEKDHRNSTSFGCRYREWLRLNADFQKSSGYGSGSGPSSLCAPLRVTATFCVAMFSNIGAHRVRSFGFWPLVLCVSAVFATAFSIRKVRACLTVKFANGILSAKITALWPSRTSISRAAPTALVAGVERFPVVFALVCLPTGHVSSATAASLVRSP